MRVRYRRLRSEFDGAEFKRILGDDPDPLPSRRGEYLRYLIKPAVAAAETPRQVTSSDAEAQVTDVRRMLASGRLTPQDLVDVGNGWETIGECHLFSEDCEVFRARDRLLRVVWWVGIFAAALAAVLLLMLSRAE